MFLPKSEDERKFKKVFELFTEWFVRNKYIGYVVKDGRMKNKETYIDYKNKYVLYLADVVKNELYHVNNID